jgi:hypothetical protein
MRKFIEGNTYFSSSGLKGIAADIVKILKIDEKKDNILISYRSPNYFNNHKTNDTVARIEYTKQELNEFLNQYNFKKC